MDPGDIDYDVDDYYFSATPARPTRSPPSRPNRIYGRGRGRGRRGPPLPRSRACMECKRKQLQCDGRLPRCFHCADQNSLCSYEQLGPAVAHVQVMAPLVVPKKSEAAIDVLKPPPSEQLSPASDSPTLGSRKSVLPKFRDIEVSLIDEPLPAHTGIPQPNRRGSSPLSKSSVVLDDPVPVKHTQPESNAGDEDSRTAESTQAGVSRADIQAEVSKPKLLDLTDSLRKDSKSQPQLAESANLRITSVDAVQQPSMAIVDGGDVVGREKLELESHLAQETLTEEAEDAESETTVVREDSPAANINTSGPAETTENAVIASATKPAPKTSVQKDLMPQEIFQESTVEREARLEQVKSPETQPLNRAHITLGAEQPEIPTYSPIDRQTAQSEAKTATPDKARSNDDCKEVGKSIILPSESLEADTSKSNNSTTQPARQPSTVPSGTIANGFASLDFEYEETRLKNKLEEIRARVAKFKIAHSEGASSTGLVSAKSLSINVPINKIVDDRPNVKRANTEPETAISSDGVSISSDTMENKVAIHNFMFGKPKKMTKDDNLPVLKSMGSQPQIDTDESSRRKEPTFDEVLPPVPPPKDSKSQLKSDIAKPQDPESTRRPVSTHTEGSSVSVYKLVAAPFESPEERSPSNSVSTSTGPSIVTLQKLASRSVDNVAKTTDPLKPLQSPLSGPTLTQLASEHNVEQIAETIEFPRPPAALGSPRLVQIPKHSPASSLSSTTYPNSVQEKASNGVLPRSPLGVIPRKPLAKATPAPSSKSSTLAVATPPVGPPVFFSITDLVFLHHYTVSTAKTLGALQDDEYRHVWQTQAPKIAQSHPFLMYALLAIGGAHLARVESTASELRQRYHQLGRDHFIKALTGFQSTIDQITPEVAGVVYCFCTLVIFLTFTVELDEPGKHSNPIDSFVGNISILKGSANMMEYAREHITHSPVGHLLDASIAVKPNTLDPGVSVSIDLIEGLIGRLTTAESVEYSAYLDAIMKLRHFYIIVTPRPDSWARVIQWPLRLTPAFFELLRKKKPPALVILAHWIVPLYHAPKRWFLGGWPKRMIRCIVKHVPSSDWAQGLEWPMQEMGML